MNFETLNFTADGLMESMFWLRVTNVLCAVGFVVAAFAAVMHGVQRGRALAGKPPGKDLGGLMAIVLLGGSIVTISISIWNRYVEVNHFPSQTMSEVLVMFAAALLFSMFVLHFALKLKSIGLGWAIVGDVLVCTVFLSTWFTNMYSTSLSTAQKDLPPALQSYWFPPHLAALIFSYATLGIAAVVCLVYFSIRFWTGIFHGGWSKKSQLLILAGLVLIPFSHVVTAPVFVIVGLVFLCLRLIDRMPDKVALAGLEKTMDEVSYRAFSVGIPFLTAGLFMGAFWAQEAWANYWGWDSKENSALITWLVYIVYVHLRMLGGYRGEKAMSVLMGGAVSVFLTFQLFGFLPDSQKSLHRYTDDGVTPREGMQGATASDDSARLDVGAESDQ